MTSIEPVIGARICPDMSLPPSAGDSGSVPSNDETFVPGGAGHLFLVEGDSCPTARKSSAASGTGHQGLGLDCTRMPLTPDLAPARGGGGGESRTARDGEDSV